ncbi:hypothetical protein Stsp02_14580 [Streptomyces sp. NBRC 14336]|nr:hypothetical protein Stsp02_14580 [Streptomyces sp. NBRC 14336]
MTNSTLGPGTTISRNDMAAKARRRSEDTMSAMEAAPAPVGHRVFQRLHPVETRALLDQVFVVTSRAISVESVP